MTINKSHTRDEQIVPRDKIQVTEVEKHRSRDIGLSPLYFASFFPFVKQFQNGNIVQGFYCKLIVFIWQSLLSVLPPKPQRQVLPLAGVQQMHGRETYSQRLSNASAPDKCNHQPLGMGTHVRCGDDDGWNDVKTVPFECQNY